MTELKTLKDTEFFGCSFINIIGDAEIDEEELKTRLRAEAKKWVEAFESKEWPEKHPLKNTEFFHIYCRSCDYGSGGCTHEAIVSFIQHFFNLEEN